MRIRQDLCGLIAFFLDKARDIIAMSRRLSFPFGGKTDAADLFLSFFSFSFHVFGAKSEVLIPREARD